jgi:outer membrane immunogenic protein
MKYFTIGGIALLAIGLEGTAARAADMPVTAPPPPVVVANWTGCYAGLSAGASVGKSHQTAVAETAAIRGGALVLPGAGATLGAHHLTGFIGGAGLGCNYQAGAWVFGVEGDWSVTNKEGQSSEPINFPNWIASTKERWLATARLRLGYTVWDKSLLYVTGGGAWTKVDILSALIPGGPGLASFTQTDQRAGWTAGIGWEYALGYGWSVKSEFLYVKFDTWRTFTGGAIPANVFAPREVKLEDFIVRAGMSYKFGGY